jgi:hypothetical protein
VGTDANALTLLHFRYSGAPPSAAQCATYCTSFNALTAAEWPLVLSTFHSYLGCGVVDLSGPLGQSGSAGTAVAGTRGSDYLGASSCVLVHYPIGRRYRGGKPRSYLPWGVHADLTQPQVWLPASVTDFTTVWASILNAVVAAGPIGSAVIGSQVNVSYYGPPNRLITGSTGRVRTISTTRVTPLVDDLPTFSISNKVASQRRRNLQRT